MRGRMREESLTEKISKPSYDIFNQKRVKGFEKKRKGESGGVKKEENAKVHSFLPLELKKTVVLCAFSYLPNSFFMRLFLNMIFAKWKKREKKRRPLQLKRPVALLALLLCSMFNEKITFHREAPFEYSSDIFSCIKVPFVN